MKRPHAPLAALALTILSASCGSPLSMLDEYNSNFTPVATSQATFELNEETQDQMLEPVYRISSEATLSLTAPAVGSSYRWAIKPIPGSGEVYYWNDQSINLYIPQQPKLFDGSVDEAVCELRLQVVKDGVTYKDEAILIIEKR